MRKVAATGAIAATLLMTAAASARDHWIRVKPAIPVVAQPVCPAGVPIQDVQVINQAGVPDYRLARVERAAVDQSLQVRRWWGTPCLHFAADGWKLYLKRGPEDDVEGVHYAMPTRMLVWTGHLNYEMWSHLFTHELVETLEDPLTTNSFTVGNQNGGTIEIADPVEWETYRLDGVNVTDFVTPAWYAGARLGACAAYVDGIHCDGPLVASATSAGPYDQAGKLRRPWQTLSGPE